MANMANQKDDAPCIDVLNKPGQSMKTQWMLQRMAKLNEKIRELGDDDCEDVVTVILCNNRLLETEQLDDRCKAMFSDTVLFSSKADCNDYYKLYHEIVQKGKRRIILCTNKVRLRDISKLVRETEHRFSFDFWIDEIDANIKILESEIRKWEKCEKTKKITAITGTVDLLYKRFNSLNIIPLKETHDQNYLGLADHEFKIIPKESVDTVNYIRHVLQKEPSRIVPGTKWFIPADVAMKTHDKVAEVLNKKGFAVVIINGTGLVVKIPDKDSFVIPKGQNIIAKEMDRFGRLYSKYPLAITGNMCVERGITLMSENFIFDYAIIGTGGDPSKLTQIFWRLCGQFKNLVRKKTIVFTTENIRRKVMDMNQKSIELAKIANELKQSKSDDDDVNGIPVEKKVYKEIKYAKNVNDGKGSKSGNASNPKIMNTEIKYTLYIRPTIDEVKKTLKFLKDRTGDTGRIVAKFDRNKDDKGYLVSALMNNQPATIMDVKQKYDNVFLPLGIRGNFEPKKVRFHLVPCYEKNTFNREDAGNKVKWAMLVGINPTNKEQPLFLN